MGFLDHSTNNIIVDAVLLTHMLINAVVIIKPATIIAGLVPEKDSMLMAILLWRPHDSIAEAIINPPRKRRTNGCAYELEISWISKILKNGKRTIGIKPVT